MLKKNLIFLFLISSVIINAQIKLNNRLNLMPWPKSIVENHQQFIINNKFSISINDAKSERLNSQTTRFLRRLSNRTGVFLDKGFALKNNNKSITSLIINYKIIGKLKLGVDESYELKILDNKINIKANTDIGAIRALETLLQLISSKKDFYYFPGVEIHDSPRFAWRGLMIDAARHFEPVNVIKRNLKGMAAVKLNVFHWHLSDDQGFRIQINSWPKLYQMASDGQYYTHEEIRNVVNFADKLGIRVIPELDIPGHATSWLVAYPEMASKDTIYQLQRNAGIFDPTIDPTKPITYKILGDVITEVSSLFPDKYFHIGGDENKGKQWDANQNIQNFKKNHDFKTNHDLQNYFNSKILAILKKNGKIMMGWDEILQPTLSKDVVIQSWHGKKHMLKAAALGYKTLLSRGYYIDLLKSAGYHYKNDPIDNPDSLTKVQLKNILGGEATMWGELVTPLTIDSRIWPRTAAIAERLWSPKNINDVNNMYKRLKVISFRLEALGLTHIRNKEVILRNITNNQDISSLMILSNICEPLKGYKRNYGGTEYNTFSPFTLFADACTADASDAMEFKKIVKQFLLKPNLKNKKDIIKYLAKWISNYEKFETLDKNPILKSIELPYKNLSDLSKILKRNLLKKSNHKHLKKASKLLVMIKSPFVDVEFVIHDDLERLLSYLKR
ncbi:beta-N-acetylhexosaminidase [Lutibacter sp.]|uniref:beta-N-acetylhexosaminidase n=1 Tax=Lutibacter sp. TaxID=1925666 RepID=UPI0025BBB25C|nr:beta-N-acetylhexosaminidase [Lutibacter sp.]MCF6181193.1 beta-N-acetylhexosaminidase [Lutibacter sp.]